METARVLVQFSAINIAWLRKNRAGLRGMSALVNQIIDSHRVQGDMQARLARLEELLKEREEIK